MVNVLATPGNLATKTNVADVADAPTQFSSMAYVLKIPAL